MLSPRERKTGFFVLVISIIKGLADTIGVASILPFLSVMSDPEKVSTDPRLSAVYNFFGYTSTDDFLFGLGIFVIIMLVVSAVIRAMTIYAINRWIEMRQFSLTRGLLKTYLRHPYEFYLTRNSSEMANAVLGLIGTIVFGAYRPFLNIANGLLTFLLIFSLLVVANPLATIIAVAAVGGAYIAIYVVLKPFILRMGKVTVAASKARFKIINETFAAIKQVKLGGREQHYVDNFEAPSLALARARSATATLNQLPKFGLEVVAFSGIIILTLVLLARAGGTQGDGIASALPLIGLYAFAGYRILPIVQTLYASYSQILLSRPTVDEVYDDWILQNDLARLPSSAAKPMPLHEQIIFQNISYKYPQASKAGLRNISVEIKRGAMVGIVGTTGAGKTTFIDILLGLLRPNEGALIIDDAPLELKNLRNWQANIGYVPQDIELSDTTVARNIAMGIPEDQISLDQVKAAARLAKIDTFIENELPNGYQTEVGERGVRLSGGQRQRFGIARALYHDPAVIVFDEATSALDNATEKEVIAAIDSLSKDKTILMIAHRLSTVQRCDKIIVFDAGEIVGFDTYGELLNTNSAFQGLAAGNSIADDVKPS